MRRFGLFLLGFAAILTAGSLAQAAMDEDTDNKFSIHGEVRFRGESWNNLIDFTDTENSSINDSADLWPYRVRLAAKGDLGNDIWVYGEFQASGVAGGGIFGEVEPLFGDETEFFDGNVSLYQGYVKLKDVGTTSLDLTFGRQEIVFDRGLHFSSLDFYNGISFDGVMAAWEWEDMGLQAFYLRDTENNLSFTEPVPGDSDDSTMGVHWNMMIGEGKKQDVAAYAFYQLQNDSAIDPGQDRGAIYTVGGRWGLQRNMEQGFLWNVEAAYQFGQVQPCASNVVLALDEDGDPIELPCVDSAWDLSAFVFEGAFGYMFHRGKTDQKLWAGVFYASGNDALDEDPNDIEAKAYQPLYTDFHSRLGYADLIAPTNVMALSIGYKMNIDNRHIFGAQLYDFSKAEKNDSNFAPLYGGQITPNTLDCLLVTGDECQSDSIAQELDLTYTYAMTNNFSFDTALAYVIPGDAIEDHWSTFGLDDDFGSDNAWRIYGQARARW